MTTTVLPLLTSAAELGFMAGGDDLGAKDTVKFSHSVDI